MPQKANVTSVDAIDSFRTNLVVYLSKAKPALEEVSAEIVRVRLWLENDQRAYWEKELRRRRRDREEAQAGLFSARMGVLSQESSTEQLALHKARRAVDEAETKLRVLKRWDREFDSRVQPLVKQMEKLQTLLANDMVQALAYLTQTVKTLTAYADIKAPEAAPGPSQGAGTGEGEP